MQALTVFALFANLVHRQRAKIARLIPRPVCASRKSSSLGISGQFSQVGITLQTIRASSVSEKRRAGPEKCRRCEIERGTTREYATTTNKKLGKVYRLVVRVTG